jgi:hypothetical protein
MIKWFDANMFLPGKEVGKVLVRIIDFNSNVSSCQFELGTYGGGGWWIGDSTLDEDKLAVTHWAFIEEPF